MVAVSSNVSVEIIRALGIPLIPPRFVNHKIAVENDGIAERKMLLHGTKKRGRNNYLVK